MSGLHWMPVTLALLLSAGNSLAVMDQNQLAGIVREIMNRYTPSYGDGRNFPMFSLAVSIPYNSETKMYDISKVTDTGDEVRNTIVNCEVYTGLRVVAATVLRWPNVVKQCPEGRVQWPNVLRKCPQRVATWADVNTYCHNAVNEGRADHAEYRTLQHFETLVKNHNKQDLLLFYVLASPCDKRCTSELNPFNILGSINQIMNWKNYAVVFSNVFKPRSGQPIPEVDLSGALERLGTYKGPLGSIGLKNIFRCNRQGEVQCMSCFSKNGVARYCFSDNPSPGPSKDADVSSSQSALEFSKTNVDSVTGGGQGGRGGGRAKKVGGRGVVKNRGGGNVQKSKQTQGKKKPQKSEKKTQSKGITQWSEDEKE